MDSIEPVASRVPYMVGIGNHEYDWEHKNSHEPDASGADLPYAPDWGNFGNDSGGECGVAAAKHFMMPSFAERGYWAPGANAGNASLGPDGCRNPTLDRVRGAVPSPDAAPAAGAGADAACGAANHGGLAPNPPFWYSFGQGPVHFLTISTEHDLSPHSQQYKVGGVVGSVRGVASLGEVEGRRGRGTCWPALGSTGRTSQEACGPAKELALPPHHGPFDLAWLGATLPPLVLPGCPVSS